MRLWRRWRQPTRRNKGWSSKEAERKIGEKGFKVLIWIMLINKPIIKRIN
jgi:hypothetical protein